MEESFDRIKNILNRIKNQKPPSKASQFKDKYLRNLSHNEKMSRLGYVSKSKKAFEEKEIRMTSKIQKLLTLIIGSEEDIEEGRAPMSDEKRRELQRRHRRRILKTKQRLARATLRTNADRNRLGRLLTRKI